MSEKGTSVALLFDDADLGGHLRAALSERGATIVHEGPLKTFDLATLNRLAADVYVVNLDDDADDDALDHVYSLAESGNARVVFNDAEASRSLDGWDRARWARHLAFKALETGGFDPPRPENVAVAEPSVHALEEERSSHFESAEKPLVQPPPLPTIFAVTHEELATPPFVLPADELVEHSNDEHDSSETNEYEHADDVSAETESLAAELEALLAAGDQPNGYDDFGAGSGLKFDADAELPPLHDGHFGHAELLGDESPMAAAKPLNAGASEPARVVGPPPLPPMPSDKREFQLDHLALAPIDEIYVAAVDAAHAVKPTIASSPVAPSWDLLEESAPVADEAPAAPTAANFGIEKLSAADYLAPETDGNEESPMLAGLSLELMTAEEALAPPPFEQQGNELHLGEPQSALGRMVVLGAARDSFASVCIFLSELPITLRASILLTQHLGDQSAEQLASALAANSSLPVRVAASGVKAKNGQVLLVPRGQQVRINRAGDLDLNPANEDGSNSPSIDSSFSLAANVFGRDALAVVFAGQANDGVAGAQAIHDRGGRVWVESSPGDHYTDMVNGVMAERVTSFSGSPQELAARLIEDFQ